jgi:hypothetical protein
VPDFRHSEFLGIAHKYADSATIPLNSDVLLPDEPRLPFPDAAPLTVHLIGYLGIRDNGASADDAFLPLPGLAHDAPLEQHPRCA